MDKHTLQLLLERTDLADNLRSYSGRAMYGKECLGVDVPQGGLGGFVADVIDAAVEWTQDEPDGDRDMGDVAQAFRDMRTDSMGLGTIVYFPRVPFVGDDGEETADTEDADDDGE